MENRTVLIIDDSEQDRVTLRRQLERDTNCKYAFVEEGSVQNGLQRYREGAPDCIILDYYLPDGTGLDFLHAIKEPSGQVPVPVVVLTATGNQEVAVAFMRAGAHDYLVKEDTESDALRLAVSNAMFKVQTQRQLSQQREELERLYREAQAHNEDLRLAKEAAERANAAKDEFLSMLSHELRTPLTPVLSIVSATLAEHQLSADLRETFLLIQRNTQLEARLIDDLLDLTRVLEGRVHVEKTQLDLHACIQSAIDVCQGEFDAKKVALRTEFLAHPAATLGDFSRIQQVLWSILRNAVQYTPAGGRVDVSTQVDGTDIVVLIRDTGIGIEPERLKEIFEAFNKPLPAHRSGSLGLGLAISRSIMSAHGGTITARSGGNGQGTVFHLTFPQFRPQAAVPAAAAEAPQKSFRGKTILVVEDHDDTRRVLSRALRRKGFGVTAAASVETACEQYSHHRADLVICDIGLPDGTGWDVMKRLRQEGPVRAIAVSGYGMDQDVQKSHDAGFLAHITKPVDFPKLENVIEQILQTDVRK
jgi:signal transduction histidine kinase